MNAFWELLLIWIGTFLISYFMMRTLWGVNINQRLEKLKTFRLQSFVSNHQGQIGTMAETLQFFSRFSMPTDVLVNKKLKTRFFNAGLHGERPFIIYFSAKTILVLIIPCISFLYSFYQNHSMNDAFILAIGLAIAGYWIPDLILNHQIRKRQEELVHSFPDALDLVRICVASGLGLDAAITRVGNEIRIESPILAEEFEQLSLELRAGTSRNQALTNLAMRTGLKDIQALVAMLKQANQFGTNVTEALQVFAEDLRTKRKMQAQELAAKIPVKISIPIILCIFPSLFVVILGPAIVSLFNISGGSGNPLGR